MNHPKDEDFMQLALEEAHLAYRAGEVPIGALLVQDNQVIASAHNIRERNHDPLGHAEVIAIRKAAAHLNTWKLNRATLYVTVEPCLMCAGAILQSRIQRLVYGCIDIKAGAVASLYNVLQDERLNHQVIITKNILEKACKEIIQLFFKELRDIKQVERCPSG